MFWLLRQKYLIVKNICLYPTIAYTAIVHSEDIEDLFVSLLLLVMKKILRHELRQPHIMEASKSSIQHVLFTNVFSSEKSVDSMANIIVSVMSRQETKGLCKNLTNDLLNKPWLKQLIYDTIISHKKPYEIDKLIPDNISIPFPNNK